MIEELYEILYGELVNWCCNMTGDRSRAEDLVQEAFVKAIDREETLAALRPNQQRAYLYRTVKNLFVDSVRCGSFERAEEELPETTVPADMYDELDSRELLSQLPGEEKQLFVMRYLQGYNSTELGKLLGIPPGTVRAKLSSARRHLREAMK